MFSRVYVDVKYHRASDGIGAQEVLGESLSHVLESDTRSNEPCPSRQVMSYAERKARREDEINGLKEALEILSA